MVWRTRQRPYLSLLLVYLVLGMYFVGSLHICFHHFDGNSLENLTVNELGNNALKFAIVLHRWRIDDGRSVCVCESVSSALKWNVNQKQSANHQNQKYNFCH